MNEKSQLPTPEQKKMDIFDIPPHPAADVLPMLDDDEIEELAADIRANGLLMPLLVGQLDGQTVLVDGRNRREACRRLGIVPPITYCLMAQTPWPISSRPIFTGAI